MACYALDVKKSMVKCLCNSTNYTQLGIAESKSIFQCKTCLSIWTHEYEYSLEFYKEQYPALYRTHFPNRFQHDLGVAQNRYALIAPLIQGYSILDVGGANGAFVKICQDHGHETYGIDLMVPDYQSESILIGDINTYPFHRTYDLVTAFDVIEHIPNPSLTLNRVQSLANTYIFLDQPDPETAIDIHWKHIKPKEHGFLMSALLISQYLPQFDLVFRTSQIYGKMSLIYKRKISS